MNWNRFNEGDLKRTAAVTMVVDHATLCFLERVIDPETGSIMLFTSQQLYIADRIGRAIGRQAFVIFAFCLVEGFFHTRNRGKYLLRLLLAAAVSELPFYLLNYTGEVGSWQTRSLNTLVTLSMAFAAMWLTETIAMRYIRAAVATGKEPSDGEMTACLWPKRAENKVWLRTIAAAACVLGICLAAKWLNTDYGVMGIAVVMIFYVLRGIPFAGPVTVLVLLGSWNWMEFFAAPACLMLCMYNGEKGKGGKAFFYVFYPLHLLILWGLRMVIAGY